MEKEPYTQENYEKTTETLFDEISQRVSAFDAELNEIMENKLAPQADFVNVITVTEFWCSQIVIELHRKIHDAGLCSFLYKFNTTPEMQFRNQDDELNKVITCMICLAEQ